jgi:branched-chain amino acid transport system permease protein
MIWVTQLINGVLLGGYYALLACGLSFMFGVMRIINLAHGDFAIVAACLVFLVADSIGIPPFVALIGVIPLMAGLGWLLQRGMLERSIRAGVLVPLLTTFGLAIVIENGLFEWLGADTRSLAPYIGDLAYDSWAITGHIYIGSLAALMFVVAVLLLGGLKLFLTATSLGRAIRATSADADTAELVGINARSVYAIAAAIAVALAGLAGVFLAMRETFTPYSGPTLLIFAFEAVVIGGIGSLSGTLVGGIVLGVAQTFGAQINPQGFLITGHVVFLAVLAGRLALAELRARGHAHGIFAALAGGLSFAELSRQVTLPVQLFSVVRNPVITTRLVWRRARSVHTGLTKQLCLLVRRARGVIVSSISRPTGKGGFDYNVERWTRTSARSTIVAGALLVVLAVGPFAFSANIVDSLTNLFIYLILAVMWNALAGYAGLVSVGQQAFIGLGAYFAIQLSYHGVPVYPALLLGALIAGLLSLPISLLVLRLRGGEFAIAMWVVAELAHLLIILDPLINGETGVSLLALNAFAPDARRAYNYWIALATMVVLLALVFALLRGRFGASLQAIRDDEDAAKSVGVRVLAGKRIIFFLAAFGCALAGTFWLATLVSFQPRTYFGIQWTAYMIFMVLAGGLGTFEGPILGGVIFFLIEYVFGETGVWYLMGLGAAAIFFALFLPRGIWGTIEDRFGMTLLPVGYRLQLTRPIADLGDTQEIEEAASQ